jgi:ATP citrate (pro-S)-lyase
MKKLFFYNLKRTPIQGMLDYDYICKKEPSITAIIHPGRKGFHKTFYGEQEILIPMFPTLKEALAKFPETDTLINFASFRSAYQSTKEALQTSINTIVIVAEGIPEQQTKELIALAKNKLIIGPATVGGIIAGQLRIGYAGGQIQDIIKAKLYQTGSVGLVSKSGGLMNEMLHMISRTTDGISEGFAIGGDQFPGSTLLDHMLRYEANPNIKLIVAMSELGGKDEYDIIKAKQEGRLTKPIIMWVSGTCAEIFPWEVQFGHAGAKAGTEEEGAHAKNRALKEAGIIVPESFAELENTIKDTFKQICQTFKLEVDSKSIMEEPSIPDRKPTHFTSTISSDKDELSYAGIPISKIIEENFSLGDVISLLWFKKHLPIYFSKFLEMSIIIAADHGPSVSGAHNSIVAARAGKDVVSSLCSGLLTIGPRFGGAIDDAMRYFRDACDKNTEPAQFVEEIKSKGKLIPGIGHRVKSKSNPDKRVELLKKFSTNFPETKYLNYALEVEKVTLEKAENLILNVDGCIGVLFLDALTSSDSFTKEEIDEIVEIGYGNGLFALARSIGLIGHVLDQKRLKEPLYRHPSDDVLYG